LGGGDCEDFALTKFQILFNLGVSPEKLSLAYVKRLDKGRYQSHMVLLYNDKNLGRLVLDNLNDEITPLKNRKDLVFVFGFDLEGIWLQKDEGILARVGPVSNYKKWREYLKRIPRENNILVELANN